MSSALAIATVTETLRRIIDNETDGVKVVTLPPDKLRDETGKTINLFLYQTTINAAWSNMPLPDRIKPGERGHPPLPLNLHYLLTVYGDNDTAYHRLLGQAMRIMHDHGVLLHSDIVGVEPDSDLHRQIEHVRITPHSLSLDEMTKLWTTFQTPYRPSVAYQASLVLIESLRPTRTPLPVSSRGPRDQGFPAQAGLDFPNLAELRLPPFQNVIQFGDKLQLIGSYLNSEKVEAHFRHPHFERRALLGGEAATEREFTFKSGEGWLAGWYTVSIIATQKSGVGDETREISSNELAFALAPSLKIEATDLSLESLTDADGDPILDANGKPKKKVTITMTCDPPVAAGQRVSLLLGSQEFAKAPETSQRATLSFEIINPDLGQFLLRLRVDGADSVLMVDPDPNSPTYQQYIGPKVNIHA